MSEAKIPGGTPHKNIVMNVNGKAMKVTIAGVKPNLASGEAYVSFAIDPEAANLHSSAAHPEREDSYVAIVAGSSSPTDPSHQIKDSTDAVLRLISSHEAENVVIPASSLVAGIMGIDDSSLISSMLLGISQYASHLMSRGGEYMIPRIIIAARDNVYKSFIEKSDIFGALFDESRNSLKPPAAAPANENEEKKAGSGTGVPPPPSRPRGSEPIEPRSSSKPPRIAQPPKQPVSSAPVSAPPVKAPPPARGRGKSVQSSPPAPPGSDAPSPGPVQPRRPGNTKKASAPPEARIDRGNRIFVADAFKKIRTKCILPDTSLEFLSTWWVEKLGQNGPHVRAMVEELLYDEGSEYEIGIDKHGSFVSFAVQEEEGSKAWEIHDDNTDEAPVAKAINLRFRTLIKSKRHSYTFSAPITYNWEQEGPRGKAWLAFSKWYNINIFTKVRDQTVETMSTDADDLFRRMFKGIDPATKHLRLVGYLKEDPARAYDISMTHFNLNFGESFLFDPFLEYLKGFDTSTGRLFRHQAIEVAYLEAIMRKKLGDEKVDEILRGPTAGSPGAPTEGTPPDEVNTIQISEDGSVFAAFGDSQGQAMTADEIDVHNTAFAEAVIKIEEKVKMSEAGRATISVLASWLSSRTTVMSREDIEFFFKARVFGYCMHAIFMDDAGRLIGTNSLSVARDGALTGIAYMDGNPNTPNIHTAARDTIFRPFETSDGETIHVPVNRDGDEIASEVEGFDRWYNSPAFVDARAKIAEEDNLSEIMFPGMGPRERMRALVLYLNGNPQGFDKIYREHTDAKSLYNELKRTLVLDRDIGKSMEVDIAYLEMLMRKALGDEEVDEILKEPDGGGSGTPQEGTPSPQSSGGGTQHSPGRIIGSPAAIGGIIEETVTAAPDAVLTDVPFVPTEDGTEGAGDFSFLMHSAAYLAGAPRPA